MKLFLLLGLVAISLDAQVNVATLFTKASVTGDLKTAESLLSSGLNPDSRDRFGRTLLINAATLGNPQIASLLLSYHADPNAKREPDGSEFESGATALYAAAAFGRDDVVKLLLERGADPTLCGQNAKSALQAAVENGFSGVAELLRQRTAREGCRQ